MNHLKRIVIILGIVLIIGFVAIVLTDRYSQSDKSEPAFESLEGQFALLDRTYDAWFGEKIDVTSYYQGRALLCHWYNYKSLAAEQNKSAEDVASTFKAQLMDFVMMTRVGGEYWAAETAMDELYPFYNGVPGAKEKIVESCRKYAPDLENHIDSDRNALLSLAQAEGFLLENGQLDPAKDDIIRLLHRQNWNTIVVQQLPARNIIPPEERVAFLRWQIEQAHIPFDKKLSKLELLHSYRPDMYDYHYSKAVLLYLNQNYAGTCEALTAGLNETENISNFRIERYRNALDYMAHKYPTYCAKETARQGKQ